jgi:hypothetical protein
VRVRVLAGQKTGAARRAERGGDKGASEMNAFAREAIDVGRLHEGMSGKPEIIPTLVIHQNENNIRTRWACVCTGRNRAKKSAEDEPVKSGNRHRTAMLLRPELA